MISQVWELKNRFINLQKEKKQSESDNYVTYTFNHDQLGEEVMLMSFPNRTMVKGYNLNGTDYIVEPIVTQETTEISEFVLTDKGYCTTSLMTIDSLTVNTRWRSKQPLSENDIMALVSNLDESYELQQFTISTIPQIGMLYDYGNNEYGFPQEVIDQLQQQGLDFNLGIFFAESTWDGSTIPTIDTEVAYVKTSGGIQNISIVPTSNVSELTIYCTEAFDDLGYCNKEIVRKIDGSGCNSVTSIGDEAFYECTELTSITIPNSVTSVGNNAFSGCYELTSVTIGNGVTSIGNMAFSGCTSLISVVIGNSVTSIGFDAFYNCTALTSITMPNSVTSIGNSAFGECSSLTSVTISNSVTTIVDSAFWRCTALTSITIPNSVTTIEGYVFCGCYNLTSVIIGNSVTSIVNYAFTDCTALTSITCLTETAPTIGSYTFNAIPTTGTLKIPKGSDYSSWLTILGSGWTIEEIETVR